MRLLPFLLPLCCLVSDEHELRYAPPAGTVCARTFTYTSALEGGELEVVMDGQDVPSEYLPELAISASTTHAITFTDRLLAVAGGQPTRLVRTFDAATSAFRMTVDMGDGGAPREVDVSATSPLVGHAVDFTRDAEGAVRATFAQGDRGGDLGWLAALVEPGDLRGLLPPAPVARGARWVVAGAELGALFAPGGDLAFVWTGDGAEEMQVEETRPLTGELELTLRALERRGGRERARVGLAGRVERVTLASGDLEHVPVAGGTTTETTTATHELEGELWIDPATGLVHELELAARATLRIRTVKDAHEPGPAFESTVSLAGECTFGLQLELRE